VFEECVLANYIPSRKYSLNINNIENRGVQHARQIWTFLNTQEVKCYSAAMWIKFGCQMICK